MQECKPILLIASDQQLNDFEIENPRGLFFYHCLAATLNFSISALMDLVAQCG